MYYVPSFSTYCIKVLNIYFHKYVCSSYWKPNLYYVTEMYTHVHVR